MWKHYLRFVISYQIEFTSNVYQVIGDDILIIFKIEVWNHKIICKSVDRVYYDVLSSNWLTDVSDCGVGYGKNGL